MKRGKSFDVETLGETVATALGLRGGDEVEVARDKTDSNRLLIIRRPQGGDHG